jgi:hypothetical protein
MSLAKSLTRVSTLVDLRLYRKCTRALTNQNLSVDEGVAGGGGGGGGRGGLGGGDGRGRGRLIVSIVASVIPGSICRWKSARGQ